MGKSKRNRSEKDTQMAFAKQQKTNSYFKRFQTKFRRRRESKTDYYARKRMIIQDLNKYGTPKYRFVVRISNAAILTQIVYSTITGDFCLSQARSTELKKWGLNNGFTSYAAAYATGLLLARRLLTKLGMGSMFAGAKECDGKQYDVSCDAEALKQSRRPFKAILDLGLVRSTIGNRVFGAMKGACDGGLHIPHSVNKFPGFSKTEENKKGEYVAEVHRDRIFGCHIDEYMEKLKAESDELYNKQFAKWDKTLKSAKVESVEDLFAKIHEGIRKDAAYKKVEHKKKPTAHADKAKTLVKGAGGKLYKRDRRLTYEQRKANVQMKLKIARGE